MSFETIDRRQLVGGAAGALALSGVPAVARKPVVPVATTAWPKVQAVLDSYVAENKIPGGAGSIGRGTDVATFLSAGTLARGSTTRVDADSLFRLYSMTKPITGMAAMMLIEDGRIGLDQNIGDFIPGFKNAARPDRSG